MHLRITILLTLLASFPLHAAKKPPAPPESVNTLLAAIDEATRNGGVVVLTAIPHPQKIGGLLHTSEVPGFLMADSVFALPPFSARTVWQHDTRPKQFYMTAFSSNALESKPTLYLWQSLEVQVISPGTYRLNIAESYRIDATLATLPKPVSTINETDGIQARARLEEVTYRKLTSENLWEPPRTQQERHTQQVCISVHVASGNCVAYRQDEYWTPKHTDGYWYTKTRETDVPAVRILAGIPAAAAPLAFTVKPGQIVLSDRFTVLTDGVDYDSADRCEDINANTRDCLLRRFTVHVKPAPIDAVRQQIALNASQLTAEQKALLARLEPMQVQVLGRTGTPDPLLGTPVSLRKPADGSAGAK